MPDRYIIHGATYCGDGTASNEAASAGAAGAWNNINILTGTAPTNTTNIPTAGDTIYIRSKSGNGANADITVTMTAANLTWNSGTPTAAAPITWILDNGDVWSGVDGTLKFTNATQSYYVTVAQFNHVIAKSQDKLIFEMTATTGSSNNRIITIAKGAVVENAKFDWSAKTAGTGANTFYIDGTAINPNIVCGYTSTAANPLVGLLSDDTHGVLVNPSINLTVATSGVLFSTGVDNRTLSVYGGMAFGTGATTGLPLILTAAANAGGRFKLFGFQYPNTITLPNPLVTGQASSMTIESYGDDGKQGSVTWGAWGWASSRSDNNPPYLNATLPDSTASAWAWRVYPIMASIANMTALSVSKTYTDTAAAKTITLEFLLADTFTTLDKSNLWIDVSYIDHTTGDSKGVSSRLLTATALDTSTAGWSATTWGLVSFDKKKLSVTTPTSIKQDTPVIVTLRGTKAAVGTGDILFVCPDVQLS